MHLKLQCNCQTSSLFSDVEFYLLNYCIYKMQLHRSYTLEDIVATQLYLSGFLTLIAGQYGLHGHDFSQWKVGLKVPWIWNLEFGQGFTTYIVWLKLYYFIDLIMCGVKFWQANSAFLCDIHLLMGLTCVLSIMETMQSLLKFAR